MDKMKKFEDYTIKELKQRIKDLETPKVWKPFENFWYYIEIDCKRVGYDMGTESFIKYLLKLNKQEKLELKLYLAQRAWKKEFDDVEVDWERDDTYKYTIYYDNYNNKYDIGIRYSAKYIMQVYFTTGEKALQCLQWLKDSGVIE